MRMRFSTQLYKETRYGILQSMRRSGRRWNHHLRGLQQPRAGGAGSERLGNG